MADDILKRCTLCGEVKPGAMFSPRKKNKDGLYSWCKACSAARAREWAAENRERVKANNKARYWADPEAARAAKTASYRRKTGGGPAKGRQEPVADAHGALTFRCSKCDARKPTDSFYLWPDGSYRSLTCKQCTAARHREYVIKHADSVKAYKKRWSEETGAREAKRAKYAAASDAERAERTAKAREWVAKNPEKRNAISQNYKHRRRAQEEGGISSADLLAWKKGQPKVCYWCGAKCSRNFTVDHYQPLAKGGKHQADNLVIACRPCNLRKNAKPPEEFAASLGRLF